MIRSMEINLKSGIKSYSYEKHNMNKTLVPNAAHAVYSKPFKVSICLCDGSEQLQVFFILKPIKSVTKNKTEKTFDVSALQFLKSREAIKKEPKKIIFSQFLCPLILFLNDLKQKFPAKNFFERQW